MVSLQSIPVGGGTITGIYWPEVLREISHDEQQRMIALDGVHRLLPAGRLARTSNGAPALAAPLGTNMPRVMLRTRFVS